MGTTRIVCAASWTRGLTRSASTSRTRHPPDAKQRSRERFRELAAEIAAAGVLVFVRTNLPGQGMEEDLQACLGPELHCLSLPKVESGAAVAAFAEEITAEGARQGIATDEILIRPVIETALGVYRAYEIAAASSRVAYMGGVEGGLFGDLGGSIGYEQTDDGRETLYLRSKVLLDARAAGVPFPIGGGTTARRDADAQRAFALENRILGYTGIHCAADPAVIAAVNEVFSPREADLAEWEAVLPDLEAAEAAGQTVAHIDGRIYDLVGLERVRSQFALARRIGLRP